MRPRESTTCRGFPRSLYGFRSAVNTRIRWSSPSQPRCDSRSHQTITRVGNSGLQQIPPTCLPTSIWISAWMGESELVEPLLVTPMRCMPRDEGDNRRAHHALEITPTRLITSDHRKILRTYRVGHFYVRQPWYSHAFHFCSQILYWTEGFMNSQWLFPLF